jgi:hypothetical protein
MTKGTREQWLVARRALLEREKELTRRSDELARERQGLPWVEVDDGYRFATSEGTKTLAELFDGGSQLLVSHLMFGPDDTVPCIGCSYTADNLDGAPFHLADRDVTFVAVSRAPLDKIQAYQRRSGWTFPWVSAFGNDFTCISPCSPRRSGGPARASTSVPRGSPTSTSVTASCTGSAPLPWRTASSTTPTPPTTAAPTPSTRRGSCSTARPMDGAPGSTGGRGAAPTTPERIVRATDGTPRGARPRRAAPA